MPEFRAGAARLPLSPPLDLPMVGFVRQPSTATGYGRHELETTAIARESGGTRVVLCRVDIVGIGEPEISRVGERVAAGVGADEARQLLTWKHTRVAPAARH